MLKFPQRLKELRLEKKLSALQLSKELKVNDTTILRWEKGIIIPSIEQLYNIAIFFNVSSDFLLGLED